MTEPCPIGLDCLILASECGYPSWTESQCLTWRTCNECSHKGEEEIEQLKEEITRLQAIPFSQIENLVEFKVILSG